MLVTIYFDVVNMSGGPAARCKKKNVQIDFVPDGFVITWKSRLGHNRTQHLSVKESLIVIGVCEEQPSIFLHGFTLNDKFSETIEDIQNSGYEVVF